MARANRNQQQNNNGSAVNDPEVLSYAEMVESEFLRLYHEKDIANVPERRKPNAIDSLWSEIHKIIFKPDKPQCNNVKSKVLPYQVDIIESIIDIYCNLCNLYGGVIKYNQFCKLIGYSRYTIDLWNKLNKESNGHYNKYIFTINDDMLSQEYNTMDNIIIIYNINNSSVDKPIKYINNYSDKRDELSMIRFDVKKKLQEAMQDENTNALSVDTMGAAIRANNEEELGKLYEPKRMIQAEQIKQIATAGQLPRFEISSGNTQPLINKGL